MGKRIELAIIHCTATPQSMRITKEMLEDWGRKRGWTRQPLGYKGLIHQNGVLEELVPDNGDDIIDPWEITNGAKGLNDIAIHYAYAGGVEDDGLTPKDTRTKEQRITLTKLCLYLIKKYPKIKIAGHNQFANKACPSFDVQEWLKSLGIPLKNRYQG